LHKKDINLHEKEDVLANTLTKHKKHMAIFFSDDTWRVPNWYSPGITGKKNKLN
jgi:hypothetical protein